MNSKIRWVPATSTKRPVTHTRACRCDLCAPRLDFDKQREKDRPEIEQLRAEVERLRIENHGLRANQRAERKAEKEAAAPAIVELEKQADEKLAASRAAKLRMSNDPRLKRLQALRERGISLASAFNQIDREDDTQ